MISELTIKNLALIDSARLVFGPGFSVFTGETGAGKSILLGAIGLLLGDRASSETIRSRESEAEVAGVFELDKITHGLRKLLAESDIPCEENTLIIRRVITRTDRNRIHVNQVPITLSLLRSIGEHLVDIHGQHEHQSLLRAGTSAQIIDSIPAVVPLRNIYQKAYSDLATAKRELADFDLAVAELDKQKGLLEFNHAEIAQLKLKSGEEEGLESECRLLSTIAQRQECVATIISLIDGSQEDASVDHGMRMIKKHLDTLVGYDAEALPFYQELEGAIVMMEELRAFCLSYQGTIEQETNPDRIDYCNNRLAKIQRLKKRYGISFEKLLEKEKEMHSQLQALENRVADRRLLEKRFDSAHENCLKAASELRKGRQAAASTFDTAISSCMERLGFLQGSWRTSFIPEPQLMSYGSEAVVFEVCTNPGEPFLPLSKIASGGELSRLTLAIKTVLAEQDSIPVLIFDEIDAGIGGKTAVEVASCLHQLGRLRQVISISHLHQIASKADEHFKVFKLVEQDRTVTRVKKLSEEEKIPEIARMLGSDSSTAQKHAAELLSGLGESF